MIALRIASAVFLVLALARLRWAYVIFVALALISFAARAQFRLDPHPCELLVDAQTAVSSFGNFPHIILFALFFLLSRVQFAGVRASRYAALATVVMGALVELAEGVSGEGHCRLRDLLPDATGAALGWLIYLVLRKARQSVPHP